MVYREDGEVFAPSVSEDQPMSCEANTDQSNTSEREVKVNERAPTTASPQTYCLCHGRETSSMIQCDGCNGWYHYLCVALSPEDPPLIATYYCPTCYRAGIGQTIWHGGAVFSKHQNRRVHEVLLRPTNHGDLKDQLDGPHQIPDHRPPPARLRSRYERKREFYVKRLPNGHFTTLRGAPIVIDPPHNAPLPDTTITPAYQTLLGRSALRASRGGQVRSSNASARPNCALHRRAASPLQPSRANTSSGITTRQHSTNLRLSAAGSLQETSVNRLQPSSSVELQPGEESGCAAAKIARQGAHPQH